MVSLKLESLLVLRAKKLLLMDDNPHSLTSTTKHVLFLTSGKLPFLRVSSACTALGAGVH